MGGGVPMPGGAPGEGGPGGIPIGPLGAGGADHMPIAGDWAGGEGGTWGEGGTCLPRRVWRRSGVGVRGSILFNLWEVKGEFRELLFLLG